MPTIVITDAQTGNTIERDMTPEEEAQYLPTTADFEADAQSVADRIMAEDDVLKALALATVDLRMADVSGLTTQQVRQQFRDRIVFYLRQNRGL